MKRALIANAGIRPNTTKGNDLPFNDDLYLLRDPFLLLRQQSRSVRCFVHVHRRSPGSRARAVRLPPLGDINARMAIHRILRCAVPIARRPRRTTISLLLASSCDHGNDVHVSQSAPSPVSLYRAITTLLRSVSGQVLDMWLVALLEAREQRVRSRPSACISERMVA